MTAQLHALMLRIVLAVLAVFALWFAWDRIEHGIYQRGYDQAVENGKAQREADAAANLEKERALRFKLAAKDAEALDKEKQHAQDLAAAQRRVRAGTDRLYCPASAVPQGSAPADRPAAIGNEADGSGAAIVPETASDLLGHAAAIAGIVRKFDRLESRCESWRQMNNAE